jgi:Transposase DDE domain
MDIVALFYDLDKFAVGFEPQYKRHLIEDGKSHRDRGCQMCLSEIMTILVLFHDSNYRTLKHFYLKHVCEHLQGEFPRRLSYGRFVEQIPRAFAALTVFLQTRMGSCSGISFIDSTPLRVCRNLRINSHKVMSGLAGRGKTSTGWFYGFKLHLVINDQGELLNVCFTPGNVDDRKPVPKLSQQLFGKLVGDKGYISQDLFAQLFGRGLQLITRLKSNMKNRLILLWDKLLLRKRAVVETVIDQLKNISQIEHSRHRSQINYFTEIVAGLIAYTYREKLPSLNLRTDQFAGLEECLI